MFSFSGAVFFGSVFLLQIMYLISHVLQPRVEVAGLSRIVVTDLT